MKRLVQAAVLLLVTLAACQQKPAAAPGKEAATDSPLLLVDADLIRVERSGVASGPTVTGSIQAEKKAVAEVKVLDEPVTVVVSEKGWVRARQGHGHDPAGPAPAPGARTAAGRTQRAGAGRTGIWRGRN